MRHLHDKRHLRKARQRHFCRYFAAGMNKLEQPRIIILGTSPKILRQFVVLVVEHRNGIPLRVKINLLIYIFPKQREAKDFIRYQLDYLFCRGAPPFATGHLFASNEKKFIRNAKRLGILKHSLRNCFRHVARAALRVMVFTAAFDVYSEHLPLCRPVNLPGKFCFTVKGRNFARMSAALGPCHRCWVTSIGHLLTVPPRYFSGAEFAAILANNEERVPVAWPWRAIYFFIDSACLSNLVEGHAYSLVHLAAQIQFARAIKLRREARFFNCFDVLFGKVLGIIFGLTIGRRDGEQRLPHLFLIYFFIKIDRQTIHGIHIDYLLFEHTRYPRLAQPLGNGSVQCERAHRAYMHPARSRLFVTDKKRLAGGNFIFQLGFNLPKYAVQPKHSLIVRYYGTYAIASFHRRLSCGKTMRLP